MSYVAFETLEDTMMDEERWVDAWICLLLYWFARGLFEGIMDKTAPGDASGGQTCRGHDHDDWGGINITRNKVYSVGQGQRSNTASTDAPFAVTTGAGEGGSTTPATTDAKWIIADRNASNGGIRTAASLPLFKVPVGPGITNASDPPTATPYLDAYVAIDTSGASHAVRLAIYSADQNAFSTVGVSSTGTALTEWVYIAKIPCTADAWNDMDLYVQTTVDSIAVEIVAVQISESDTVSGSAVSQVGSSGTVQIGGV